MKELGLFDTQFINMDENVVKIEDRGYQFGDGIYEACHVYNGKCFALDRHLERMRRSLKEIALPIMYADEEIVGMHEDLIEKSQIQNGSIYFQFTRGTAPRKHYFPAKSQAHMSMTIRESEINTDWQEHGIKAVFYEDIRWLRCDIKSLNLLGNVMAKQEAHEKGCQEAILVRKEKNEVTEGSSSNFFMVKDGVLWTHPLNDFILKGVTRSIIAEKLAPKLDLTIVEKIFTPQFVLTAEEAFVTSTSLEITPVISIDRHQIGNGEPGPITRKLMQAYKDLVKEECGN